MLIWPLVALSITLASGDDNGEAKSRKKRIDEVNEDYDDKEQIFKNFDFLDFRGKIQTEDKHKKYRSESLLHFELYKFSKRLLKRLKFESEKVITIFHHILNFFDFRGKIRTEHKDQKNRPKF